MRAAALVVLPVANDVAGVVDPERSSGLRTLYVDERKNTGGPGKAMGLRPGQSGIVSHHDAAAVQAERRGLTRAGNVDRRPGRTVREGDGERPCDRHHQQAKRLLYEMSGRDLVFHGNVELWSNWAGKQMKAAYPQRLPDAVAPGNGRSCD